MARLKKVVEYLKQTIGGMDVELVPKTIWDSFQQQSNECLAQVKTYKSNRNVAHLINANNNLLINSKSDVSELDEFHKKIFGTQDAEGKRIDGLKQELDTRVIQIDALEQNQTKKYNALFEKIERLLPGATSAGLAKAHEVTFSGATNLDSSFCFDSERSI